MSKRHYFLAEPDRRGPTGDRNVLAVQLDSLLSRRNPVPREEFVQSAPVNTRQRVEPMNAGSHLLRFDVVQSTGREDEGWLAKLPCQT
jgi:hypothetical protein